MEKKICERIARAIEDKVFPGCVVGFTGRKIGTGALALGRTTYDDVSPVINEGSIFDVASITKAVPTSSLALLLVDRRRLGLDDPLIRYIPEFNNSSREKVLIRHLLTQTLDYNFRLSAMKDHGPDGILNAIFSSEFAKDPGTTFFYSNATSILLGIVVERVFGKGLDAVAEEEFFAPLDMNSTSFFCNPAQKCDIVPTEFDPWRGRMIQAEVHDESAWVLRQGRMVAGSAGLFSTVPDLLKFLEILLKRGVVRGKRYFSESIIEQMHTNQLGFPGVRTGLGWELFQARYMGSRCTDRTIGKTGFTGCVCECDFGKPAAFVLLSNYTFPHRKPDSRAIDGVRRDIADIIFSHE
jgi:CubicO group peptidase (beta-lactamase class C family)